MGIITPPSQYVHHGQDRTWPPPPLGRVVWWWGKPWCLSEELSLYGHFRLRGKAGKLKAWKLLVWNSGLQPATLMFLGSLSLSACHHQSSSGFWLDPLVTIQYGRPATGKTRLDGEDPLSKIENPPTGAGSSSGKSAKGGYTDCFQSPKWTKVAVFQKVQ